MLKALRTQVQHMLYAVPAKRKPALRRTDAPDALLASDLPQVAAPEGVDAFRAALACLGWRCMEQDGWLMLDAPIPVPEADVPAGLTGACGCCISLLLRHPDNGPAEEEIRAVVKAADAGRIPFERLCGRLHGELAAKLRQHEALPGGLLPYLCRAYADLYM